MIRKNIINKILKENKEYFEAFEQYDKTKELPIGRKRIDITLDVRIIKKLREIKNKTGKPISQIIEDNLKKELSEKSAF